VANGGVAIHTRAAGLIFATVGGAPFLPAEWSLPKKTRALSIRSLSFVCLIQRIVLPEEVVGKAGLMTDIC
jgi:hypothetical protein